MADKTKGESIHFTVDDFNCLVFKNVLPENKKDVSYLTFGFFDSLFDYCEESSSKGLIEYQYETIQNVIELVSGLDREVLEKCSNFTHIRNLKRKVRAKLKTDSIGKYRDVVVKDFVQLHEESIARGQCGEEAGEGGDSPTLGPACRALGISPDLLFGLLEDPDALKKNNFTKVKLSNEVVLELAAFQTDTNKPFASLAVWISELGEIETSRVITGKAVRFRVASLQRRKHDLIRNKKKEDLASLLKKEFKFSGLPTNTESEELQQLRLSNPELAQIVEGLQNDRYHIDSLESVISEQSQCISTLVEDLEGSELALEQCMDECKQKQQSKTDLEKEIKKQKLVIEKKSTELRKALDKIGKFNPKNVTKRINRREEEISELKSGKHELELEISDLNAEIETLRSANDAHVQKYKDEIDELNVKLADAKHGKVKAQHKASFYKCRLEQTVPLESEQFDKYADEVASLGDENTYLENELAEKQEQIEDLLSGIDEAKFFEGGTYKNEVREVYQKLISNCHVSANNVHKVVETVLTKLAGKKFDRLPKSTFAKAMYLESRAWSQIQLAEQLVENWDKENLTMHSDATSKQGEHYGCFQVGTSSGDFLTLGLRKMFTGDAETNLEVLQNILGDIFRLRGFSGVDVDERKAKILFAVKNLMSDRHIVQKKFNELLTSYRTKVIPAVVENWDSLSEEEKDKLLNLNDFFCGMHYVVGLSDQAEEALKVWEELIFEGAKVGSQLLTRGYSKGESGTLRLIRTICKAVQSKGCQKSGRSVDFLAFLKDKVNSDEVSIPLAPFVGNRFNIMFHNAAGLYFLEEDLKEFLNIYKDENDLLRAVNEDIRVKSYIVGARALGLISKLITVPLWHVLEDKSVSILDMSKKYTHLVECFDRWSKDPSKFMKGEEIAFDNVPISKDDIYFKLVEPSEERDVSTRQILSIIFASFVNVSSRMLSDHLPEGKFYNPSEEVAVQAKATQKTNVENERQFASFDCFFNEKPRMTSYALEGLLMFRQNKTDQFQESLTEEQRANFHLLARRSKAEQIRIYKERTLEIWNKRKEKVEKKKEDALKKKAKEMEKKENLTLEITKVDGLWMGKPQALDYLNGKTERQKVEALKIQIKFRRFVLGAEGKQSLFAFSHAGKQFGSDQLLTNLLEIISQVRDPESDEDLNEQNEVQIVESEKVELARKNYLEKAAKETKKRKLTEAEGAARKRPRLEALFDPPITMPEHLLGKRVEHVWNDDGEIKWFNGTVFEMHGRKRISFDVRYDNEDEFVPKVNLWKDFEQHLVVMKKVDKTDFIGQRVAHKLENDEEEEWLPGMVIDVVNSTDNNNSTELDSAYFLIKYDGLELDDDLDDEDSGLHAFPIIQEYYQNLVRFL